jgi:hypothetical protein
MAARLDCDAPWDRLRDNDVLSPNHIEHAGTGISIHSSRGRS